MQPDEASAVRRELQIKRWTKAKKEALISGNFDTLRRLSHLRTVLPAQGYRALSIKETGNKV